MLDVAFCNKKSFDATFQKNPDSKKVNHTVVRTSRTPTEKILNEMIDDVISGNASGAAVPEPCSDFCSEKTLQDPIVLW